MGLWRWQAGQLFSAKSFAFWRTRLNAFQAFGGRVREVALDTKLAV